MLVKDLKVGAMYRLQSFDGSPQKINFGYYPDFEDCMVSLVNGEGLGDKFVYLGTKTLEYKEGSTIDATRRTHGVLGCLATRCCQSHQTFGLTLNQWRKHESI